MSSAILYIAIVAIWAGVLIPRWLRRDSSPSIPSSSSSSGEQAGDDLTAAEPDSAADQEPAPRPRRREDPAPARRPEARQEGRSEAPSEARSEARSEGRPEGRSEGRPEAPATRREVPGGGPRDREHRQVLSSRRRLLGLLLVLAIGSGTLAVTRLAAWWVVVPPSVMLLGYMAMLREAARADAERQEPARTRAAEAAPAVAPVAGRPVAGRPVAGRPVAASPAADPAPVPDAEVIDISASVGPADREFYDQYADAKLRAVGD